MQGGGDTLTCYRSLNAGCPRVPVPFAAVGQMLLGRKSSRARPVCQSLGWTAGCLGACLKLVVDLAQDGDAVLVRQFIGAHFCQFFHVQQP